jgi:hypothetical protein
MTQEAGKPQQRRVNQTTPPPSQGIQPKDLPFAPLINATVTKNPSQNGYVGRGGAYRRFSNRQG